jgi:hypothetical protein
MVLFCDQILGKVAGEQYGFEIIDFKTKVGVTQVRLLHPGSTLNLDGNFYASQTQRESIGSLEIFVNDLGQPSSKLRLLAKISKDTCENL